MGFPFNPYAGIQVDFFHCLAICFDLSIGVGFEAVGLISLCWGVWFQSICLDWEGLATYLCLSLGGLLAFVMYGSVAKFYVNFSDHHLVNSKVWSGGLLWSWLPRCLRIFRDLGLLYCVFGHMFNGVGEGVLFIGFYDYCTTPR